MKKIAVVLSGCGFKDGSEITEAISTLIAIGEQGASYQCFAPDKNVESTDHFNDDPTGLRNTLSESARICRGEIKDISELEADDYDALVFPGGFGAALHLSGWANEGANCKVLPDVVRTIQAFSSQTKPIGAMCIAPTLLAKVLGDKEVTLTIGTDQETAQEIEKTGAIHEECAVDDYITDRANRIVTTPAYMFGEASPAQVYRGVSGMIKELVEMA